MGLGLMKWILPCFAMGLALFCPQGAQKSIPSEVI